MKLTSEHITKQSSEKKIISVPMSAISSRDINPRKGGLIAENLDALIEAKGEFPEIFLGLYENELIIIDGWHRYTANQRNDIKEINAFIMEFDSISDMKLQAFKANVNHGIKLTDIDIAINLYEFYLEKIKTDATVSVKKLISELGVKERRGRSLFAFSVIHKEILGEIPNEINNISFYEEYYSLLKKNNEIIGSISEEFKIKFKNFYNRYKNLPKSELRLAINDFAEGKDYFEEKAKAEAEFERMQKEDWKKKEEEYEKISKEDLIDRTGNSTTLNEVNPIIKELIENHEDKEKEELINKEKEDIQEIIKDNKKVSIDKYIEEIKDVLTKVKMLCIKDKAIITKENKLSINEIMDNLDELVTDYSGS